MCKTSPWSDIIARYQARVNEINQENVTLQTSVQTLMTFHELINLRRAELVAEREMLLAHRPHNNSALMMPKPAMTSAPMAVDLDVGEKTMKTAGDTGFTASKMEPPDFAEHVAVIVRSNDLIQTLSVAKAFEASKLLAIRVPPPVPEVITAPRTLEMPCTSLARDPAEHREIAGRVEQPSHEEVDQGFDQPMIAL